MLTRSVAVCCSLVFYKKTLSQENGYGTALYMRLTSDRDQIHCSFVMGMSRVRPLHNAEEEFYPSTSQDLLSRALDFASAYENITSDKRNIIIHAKNYVLIRKQQPWQKKGDTTFDVTMGSYDGAETCELVGNFLLSQLQSLDVNIGLYRNDGRSIPKRKYAAYLSTTAYASLSKPTNRSSTS